MHIAFPTYVYIYEALYLAFVRWVWVCDMCVCVFSIYINARLPILNFICDVAQSLFLYLSLSLAHAMRTIRILHQRHPSHTLRLFTHKTFAIRRTQKPIYKTWNVCLCAMRCTSSSVPINASLRSPVYRCAYRILSIFASEKIRRREKSPWNKSKRVMIVH